MPALASSSPWRVTRRRFPLPCRHRPAVHRHEIDLGQLTAIMLKGDARHGPITLASNHDETVAGREPDLERITRPMRRSCDLPEPEAPKEGERLPQ